MPPNERGRPTSGETTSNTTGQVDTADSSRSDRQPACPAALVGQGKDLAHGGRFAVRAAMPAVGPMPDAATVLVGTLLWSAPADVADVLELVVDDDIEATALSVVLSTIRHLANSDRPCDPQMVYDELRRAGNMRRDVARALMDAISSGAIPESARYYAAAVVAGSLRRRVESTGHGLVADAETAAEAEITARVARAAAAIADCAARLTKLRGEVT